MKSKVNLIYVIVGLFLFKVGVIDNFRNIGHHSEDARSIASESYQRSNLKPIR